MLRYLEGDTFVSFLSMLISVCSRTSSSGSALNNCMNCSLQASDFGLSVHVSSSESRRLLDLERVDLVFSPAMLLCNEDKAKGKRTFQENLTSAFFLSLSQKTGSCHALGFD